MNKLRNILTSSQFNRSKIHLLMNHSKKLINDPQKYSKQMEGKILANMFFEPSTRTSSSFQSAMMRLGGNVIQFNPENSSTKKRETILDTILTMEQYTDVTVIRHPQDKIYEELIPYTKNPIINAGDGSNEHPTQALLDILTIYEELDRNNLDNLNITMVGDLKYGRTVHSLCKLLLNYDNIQFNFISPESLQMPKKVTELIKQSYSNYTIDTHYHRYLQDSDVLYMTRVQEERFSNMNEYKKVSNAYNLTFNDLYDANKNMIVMHPLPRVNEIAIEVDKHPSAKYFDQAKYGMYLRMSLLNYALGNI